MRYLPIEKDKIPYSFDVKLSDRLYTITIKYNQISDEFTADLELGGKVLVQGKKILLGEPIFGEFAYDNNLNYNPDFYRETLLPYDFSWQEEVINLDNFGDKVKIYVFEDDEDV